MSIQKKLREAEQLKKQFEKQQTHILTAVERYILLVKKSRDWFRTY